MLPLICDFDYIAACRGSSALPEHRSEGRRKQQIELREVARTPHLKLGARVPDAQNQTVGRPHAVERHAPGVKRGSESCAFRLGSMKRGKADGLRLVTVLVEEDGPRERNLSGFEWGRWLMVMHGRFSLICRTRIRADIRRDAL